MKKSSGVLLSAVFLTTVASFISDKAKAQQNASEMPAASSMQNRESDSLSHHSGYNNVVHRGFFGRLFHRNPKPPVVTNGTPVNDGSAPNCQYHGCSSKRTQKQWGLWQYRNRSSPFLTSIATFLAIKSSPLSKLRFQGAQRVHVV